MRHVCQYANDGNGYRFSRCVFDADAGSDSNALSEYRRRCHGCFSVLQGAFYLHAIP